MNVLITGATSGIGFALAKQLSDRATTLILAGRETTILQELATSLPCTVITCSADLTSDRSELLLLIEQHVPDLIINCAGNGLYGECLLHETKEQLEMIDLNIKAVVEITLEGARSLIKHQKKGTIVNVSSAASFFVYPSFAIYVSSKAFINQFSQALDYELSPKNIRVLTACPGMVRTQFRSRAAKHVPQKEGYAMNPEAAAKAILSQIQKGKTLSIFNTRFAFLTFIGRFCLPPSWRARYLKKQIDRRIR